jgi:hypothetical protein
MEKRPATALVRTAYRSESGYQMSEKINAVRRELLAWAADKPTSIQSRVSIIAGHLRLLTIYPDGEYHQLLLTGIADNVAGLAKARAARTCDSNRALANSCSTGVDGQRTPALR